MTTQTTARLASFALTATPPEPVRVAARRALLNTVALAVGAADASAVATLRDVLTQLGGAGATTVLGRRELLPAPWAAAVNAAAAHVDDFDDTHLATVVHPGAAVVPAALAAGELVDADPGSVLDAIAIGIEVAIRIGQGVAPAHFDRGWHPSGTLGHFGAVVATGRVLGLQEAPLQMAMGVAGTQAAGLLAALGTMTKSLHLAKAASDGLEAALLARDGFTAPSTIIEGRRGFGEVPGQGGDYPAMVSDLGERWETLNNTFKPYACGIVSHPALEAAQRLYEAHPEADWRRLEVRVNALVPNVMGNPRPSDGLESKFSVHHCVAIGLLGQAGGPASFTTEWAQDPRVVDLRSRIEVTVQPQFGRDEAELVGITGDGEELSEHVEHALGSIARPMDDAALATKAHLVADRVLGVSGVDELIRAAINFGRPESALVDVMTAAIP